MQGRKAQTVGASDHSRVDETRLNQSLRGEEHLRARRACSCNGCKRPPHAKDLCCKPTQRVGGMSVAITEFCRPPPGCATYTVSALSRLDPGRARTDEDAHPVGAKAADRLFDRAPEIAILQREPYQPMRAGIPLPQLPWQSVVGA